MWIYKTLKRKRPLSLQPYNLATVFLYWLNDHYTKIIMMMAKSNIQTASTHNFPKKQFTLMIGKSYWVREKMATNSEHRRLHWWYYTFLLWQRRHFTALPQLLWVVKIWIYFHKIEQKKQKAKSYDIEFFLKLMAKRAQHLFSILQIEKAKIRVAASCNECWWQFGKWVEYRILAKEKKTGK